MVTLNGLLRAFFDGWAPAVYAAIKALALFATAAAAFRLAGRRTIAELSPFDWVTAVAVGALVGRSATAPDTSWLTASAALLALMAAHGIVTRVRFFPWIRRLVDPPVRILVHDGHIDDANLRRCGLTRADLDAVLRQHGYENASDIRLAVLEAKGVISVLPRVTGNK